jgi:type III secretion protein V
MVNRFLNMAAQRQDLVFALFFILIIAMLILPMPVFLIDTLLAINLTTSLIILVTATYLKHELEISTFPSIILITTIFRVSLSVSTTRLILAYGDAGHLIKGFGNFVIGGNVVVGLVVFMIIAVVQFMVVTKGAERIAEVSARFTLDAMPGKQMSIDNDLRSGDIDKNEARRRRQTLEKESQFHGAMDGAMRFVKGDAIASLIIVFINMIGGLIIGMLQRGLPLAEAGHLYTLLSVGDGLVAQIPAMLIAVAAGTVVTRITTDESTHLGADIARQLVSHPKTIGIAAFVCVGLAVVPGFPTSVFLILAALLGGGAYWMTRSRKLKLADAAVPVPEGELDSAEKSQVVEEELPLREAKLGDTIIFRANSLFLSKLTNVDFGKSIHNRREEFRLKYGFSTPMIGFVFEDHYPDGVFSIDFELVPVGRYQIEDFDYPDRIKPEHIDYIGNIISDLWETNAAEMLTVPIVQGWLSSVEEDAGRLVQDVQQMIPFLVLVEVLRRIVGEGVGLLPPRLLLEGLIQSASRAQDPDSIAEFARAKLRRQICNAVADRDRTISALVVSPDIDDAVRRANQPDRGIPAMRVDEATIKRFVENVKSAASQASPEVQPTVLCSAESRRIVRRLLVQNGSRIPVLSYADVTQEFQVKTLGVVSAETALAA